MLQPGGGPDGGADAAGPAAITAAGEAWRAAADYYLRSISRVQHLWEVGEAAEADCNVATTNFLALLGIGMQCCMLLVVAAPNPCCLLRPAWASPHARMTLCLSHQ